MPLTGLRVYVAGPMTGRPRYNFDAFSEAAARLRELGACVTSPAEMDLALGFDPDRPAEEQGLDLEAALLRDIEAVLSCHLVALLPGWEDSCGTCIEVITAEAAGIPWRPIEEVLQVSAA